MTNEQLALFIGSFILGNIVVLWRVLVFSFEKIHQYLKLIERIDNLEQQQQKSIKDINALAEKIRKGNSK